MFLQYGDLGFVFGAYLFFMVFVLAIDVGIAVWVYRDAQSRGMDATIWLLVVILGGCVGCIVYIIISKEYPARESADWYKKKMRESEHPQNRRFDQPHRQM